ncbi:PDZ domain-containing protein [Alkalicella caledoniensis]|uniref:endopeptidase La n=1 Tax=Alkalicella caledoniensis TaxID=2731377 RepID=A0A7G9WCF7_ALKCA|nr:S16 family serine protease [Alkalicella caledoniensis]QNO16369.1 PDZ domain-containing protein [Alkalicella caledoniensis]
MKTRLIFKKVLIGLVIVSFLLGLVFLDTGYLTIQPGSAVLIEELIEIDEFPPKEGDLYLLTVSQQKASPLLYMFASMNQKVDLVKREAVIPPDMDLDEYYQLSIDMMNNSQLKAKYVALTNAKIDADITSEGVLVEKVLERGSAYGYLLEGDLITKINNENVYFDEQVINNIRTNEIGSNVNITVIREKEELSLLVPIGESETVRGTPALGIMVRNKALNLTSPIDISISTRNIGGPSAGMMFVLEIYNRLTEGDITGGLKIAGTGEILWDGSIGPIGGMKQKVFAAEKEGASILFCPEENFDEAVLYATQIEVVKVSHFKEVIDYLNNKN